MHTSQKTQMNPCFCRRSGKSTEIQLKVQVLDISLNEHSGNNWSSKVSKGKVQERFTEENDVCLDFKSQWFLITDIK